MFVHLYSYLKKYIYIHNFILELKLLCNKLYTLNLLWNNGIVPELVNKILKIKLQNKFKFHQDTFLMQKL